MYSAWLLHYTSGFVDAFQAVVYAISRSKAVVYMIGHLGPGSIFHLVNDWLEEMGSERVLVPSGGIRVGFDNEQRLLKNWLARGSNRSSVEVT